MKVNGVLRLHVYARLGQRGKGRAFGTTVVCNLLGLMICESEPREQETRADGTVRSLLLVLMQIPVHHFSLESRDQRLEY